MVRPGTVLLDRYELLEVIARGGMGQVYEARDRLLDRVIAVKMISDAINDDSHLERFRREARASGALSHPNIAAVYDFGQDGGEHFMVMERVPGRDLSQVISQDGPLAPDRAARIGSQIADALAHAHAAGIVHRDIKPSNVMIDSRDHVKVMDFGIARSPGDASLTGTGIVLGTAHYIAPEQASGVGAGSASDIYSLGVVLFEMLTGSVPFDGDSPLGIAIQHVHEEVPAPSSAGTGVPNLLDEVVRRATAKEPHERYDAAAIGAALRTALDEKSSGGDTAVMPASVWPIPGARWHPDNVGRAVLIGLFVLFVVAAGLVMLRLDSAEPSSEVRDRSKAPNVQETPSEAPAGVILQELSGRPMDEVAAELQAQGFEVVIEEVDYKDFDEGIVVGSDPAPGTELQPGQAITLFVDGGKGRANGHEKKDKDEEAD